jgi:hypothetical protein
VPFSLVGNYLVVVTGEIGGITGLNMVVDTGTARTVIDERVAARLDLRRHPDGLEVFGTRVASDRVVLDTLAFGPISARGLEALVADLEGQRKRFGVRIDALLGVDVLRGTCLTIDYASRRLAAGAIQAAAAGRRGHDRRACLSAHRGYRGGSDRHLPIVHSG